MWVTDDIETENRAARVAAAFRRLFRIEYRPDGLAFTVLDRRTGEQVGGGWSLPWNEREIPLDRR